MKSVAVFCGSSSGTDPLFLAHARRLGNLIAENRLELVYGGAQVGLMGAVADGALEAGGKVTGVLVDLFTSNEIAHPNLTSMEVSKNMSVRKNRMNELADAFIILPGGLGTLDELFEMLTEVQLGLINKPIGVLNVASYYDKLFDFLNTVTDKGFTKDLHISAIADNPEKLIEKMLRK